MLNTGEIITKRATCNAANSGERSESADLLCYVFVQDFNMTHDEFHRIVLRVANLVAIRYWNYFNYPNLPQEFAILSSYPMPESIHIDLLDIGFTFGDDEIYRIEKT